jgi:hypothetical protein
LHFKLLAVNMILGPITLVDCAVFVLFLIPQLLYQAGLARTLLTVIKVLPFLGTQHYCKTYAPKLTLRFSRSTALSIRQGAIF